jgi:hypothetical protein
MAGGERPVNTGAASIMGDYSSMNMVSLSPTANTLAIAEGGDNLTNYDKGIALLDGERLAWCQGPDANVLFKQLPPGTFYEVADERSDRERRIWLVRSGGLGEPKQLTDDPRYSDEIPVWSREGNYILFIRTHDRYISTLWLMRPNGSDPREVAALLRKGGTPIFAVSDLFDWSSRFS